MCSLQVYHLGACHQKNVKSRLQNRRWDRLEPFFHTKEDWYDLKKPYSIPPRQKFIYQISGNWEFFVGLLPGENATAASWFFLLFFFRWQAPRWKCDSCKLDIIDVFAVAGSQVSAAVENWTFLDFFLRWQAPRWKCDSCKLDIFDVFAVAGCKYVESQIRIFMLACVQSTYRETTSYTLLQRLPVKNVVNNQQNRNHMVASLEAKQRCHMLWLLLTNKTNELTQTDLFWVGWFEKNCSRGE